MHPFVIPDPTTTAPGTTSGSVPPSRRRQRQAGAALVTLMLFVLPQAPAWAHDQLLSSTPGDGKTITALPPEIILTLSEAPLATGAQVVITAADGDMVPTGTISVDEATARVTVPVTGQGPSGAYTVAWHVVSSDGHPIEGAFEFSLEPTDAETGTASSPGPTRSAQNEPGSVSTSAAPPQDTQESSSAGQRQVAAAGSHDNGRTTDPLVVVTVGIAVAIAVLIVITYVTRRRDRTADPADITGPDTVEWSRPPSARP
ncbi:copper resistance CopC family protein [Antribacter gilvus]|uniref:copper resistance CopC family protein n=1 Tax=Antribacter gilvus TaxID=2304675 RepID=UPI0013DF4EEB|nr:copper resistance protein CopC [Antribacter gilvus]